VPERTAAIPPAVEPAPLDREPPADLQLSENPRHFTLWERVQIALASWVGYVTIALVGRSLRWEVYGWENFEAARRSGKEPIFTFWHREIFAATWFWRKRGIVVMTSQNFDGEYIARIIQRHGYGAARGSSSRGAIPALKEMIRATRHGLGTAFTIDGPRGPRYVAKRGSVLLARATGAPILCFHIATRRAWVFRKSWDRTEFPRPLAHSAIFIARPILVGRDADEREQTEKLAEVQRTLDELVAQGTNWKQSSVSGK
jgi:lysophospholipid acyltransferase (LPLAT)-like uncharacterized protein